MNNFKVDKGEILKRTSRGLKWESKPPKLKRSVGSRKINGGTKFSEIKVQKTLVVMFVRDRNLERYLGKTYCV